MFTAQTEHKRLRLFWRRFVLGEEPPPKEEDQSTHGTPAPAINLKQIKKL